MLQPNVSGHDLILFMLKYHFIFRLDLLCENGKEKKISVSALNRLKSGKKKKKEKEDMNRNCKTIR